MKTVTHTYACKQAHTTPLQLPMHWPTFRSELGMMWAALQLVAGSTWGRSSSSRGSTFRGPIPLPTYLLACVRCPRAVAAGECIVCASVCGFLFVILHRKARSGLCRIRGARRCLALYGMEQDNTANKGGGGRLCMGPPRGV